MTAALRAAPEATATPRIADLTALRATDPDAVAVAWRERRPGAVPADGRLMLVAADHPARGALAVRGDTFAMGSRHRLLERLMTALSRPGVDGVLGTADILEDLLLLGALEDKVVIGSMNRGGLHGASFEFDDRFTAYTPAAIAALGLTGGKMLLRVAAEDPGSVATLTACAQAVTDLAGERRLAMVEPFLSRRDAHGVVRNQLDADAMVRAVQIASGLGATSAYTWLKLPVVPHMERVLEATTLPTLLLGGDPAGDPATTYGSWRDALALPGALGLVVGRALLYPADGDVASAVDIAARLVHGGTHE